MTPVYDRVIVGGRVMDPESNLDAVRNIGIADGRIAVVTTESIRGRDTVDAAGLVVAPGFIDLHDHGQTPEIYRFRSLDGVTTTLELELGTSDVDAWYRERSAGERINYGVSIGHIKVRMSVMHDPGTFMPVADGAYGDASPAQISGTGHPRTTGTYSRVLGRYVREAKALPLMEALRKMTLMPAQRLEARLPAMKQKGRLQVGADADIAIFDPERVMDRSTYREPGKAVRAPI